MTDPSAKESSSAPELAEARQEWPPGPPEALAAESPSPRTWTLQGWRLLSSDTPAWWTVLRMNRLFQRLLTLGLVAASCHLGCTLITDVDRSKIPQPAPIAPDIQTDAGAPPRDAGAVEADAAATATDAAADAAPEPPIEEEACPAPDGSDAGNLAADGG